jgi:hypothetical protein
MSGHTDNGEVAKDKAFHTGRRPMIPMRSSGIGAAMAQGIGAVTWASTRQPKADSDGLIPSDHIVRAMGDALEARGAKRI